MKIPIVVLSMLLAFGLMSCIQGNASVLVDNPSRSIQTDANAPTQESSPSAEQSTATLEGLVMQRSSDIVKDGTFVINSEGKEYSVIMDNAGGTLVRNLRLRQVPWQYIQVGNSVTVTGVLDGSTIKAQIIDIPTIKDDA